MQRRCEICGILEDEYWMKSFGTGTKTVWLCWKCYQNADKEAASSDMIRGFKLHKISESKKRNR